MAVKPQGPLVSTQWLAERLDDENLVVMDGSWRMPGTSGDARAEFAERHIPGAVFFGIDEICDHSSPLPHMLSEAAEFAVAARRLGVSANSLVVIYDSQGLFSSPRVWWTFRAMGHSAVFVLDGGLPRWIAEGRPLETGWREPAHGTFKARANADLVRDLKAMDAALASGPEQVVDARAAARFSGAAPEPRADLRSGHMPGARNTPWTEVLDPDGALASAERLQRVFAASGVNLSAPIVTTCGSGVSAALLALALARIGRWDVAVYDGSWTEWGARADTAVVKGEA